MRFPRGYHQFTCFLSLVITILQITPNILYFNICIAIFFVFLSKQAVNFLFTTNYNYDTLTYNLQIEVGSILHTCILYGIFNTHLYIVHSTAF